MLPIEALLKYGVSQGASDLHLVPGTAPLFRVNGQIVPVGSDHRVMDETEALVRSLLSARQMKEVETQRHLGFSFDLRGVGRFRVEAFFNMGHLAAAVRLSAFDVPKLEDLGTPVVLEKLCRVEIDIMKHLNQFLSALDGIKEGAGTLLDHTTVVIGSNFGDSSNHTCNNLPTIIAGGSHHHRTHSVLDKPMPLCNLWLELLHKHDIDVGQFGSSQMDQHLLPN